MAEDQERNTTNVQSQNDESSGGKHHHKGRVIRASINIVGQVGKVSAKAVGTAVKTVLPIKSKNDFRWEELQRIEKKRRNILKRAEEPFWKTLTHWDGTVLSHLSCDSVLWLTIALYVAVRIAAREGLPDYVASLDAGRMGIVGGFLTFFIVFYVNQSHKRYFGLYNHSMACKGRIFDAATMARTCLPQERALRLIRYMNAAHAAAYVGLSAVYPSGSYFDHIEKDFQLLTPEERVRMDQINLDMGGSAYRELIVWAMMEVESAKKKGLLDPELAAMLRTEVLKLRAAAGQLYNAADQPIPFFYVHFICLLTAMYLPLFAITQGINAGTGEDSHWVVDVVAGLVVVLQSIFVIGLRVLGQKVSDPYGDDLVDLSVMFYVQFTWLNSNRVLLSDAPPASDYAIEHDLARNRITVGAAWDAGSDRGLGSAVNKEDDNKGEPENDSRTNDDDENNSSFSSGMNEQMGFGRSSAESQRGRRV